jgi:Kef-type K+ transport system membrane component KefB
VAVWTLLVILTGLAVGAVLLSVRFGISVAILEIVLGMVAANLFGVTTTGEDWLPLLASLGSVVLTFLAGAEIDPVAMRRTWKASLSIGVVSFLGPFLAAWLFALLVLHWRWDSSLITGIALSTTSVAIVYVVLVETGSSRTETGKLILSACFVTDLGTAFALSVLFIQPNLYILLLAGATVVAVLVGPRLFAWLFEKLKDQPGEPEVKLLVFLVVLLGAAAQLAGSQAILPAYILGLSLAIALERRRDVLLRLRTLTLAFLTPFFFLNAGLNVSVAAVAAGLALLVALFFVKVGAKLAGIYPVTQRLVGKESIYISLLMSTGLTFGTISATYGLDAGLLTRAQFSVVLMVVLLTAIVPTIIAQRWFRPPRTPHPSPPPATAGPT